MLILRLKSSARNAGVSRKYIGEENHGMMKNEYKNGRLVL
jgi:hypothetical protein